MEQARLDEDYEEDEEEEEGAGDDFRVGDWCRAEWSDDAVVYEVLYRNHLFNIVQKRVNQTHVRKISDFAKAL